MILKHRDRELLRFEWVEPQGVRVVSVNEAERRFLPLSEILEFGRQSDDLLKIEAVPDSVNHVADGSLALQIKSNLNADPFMTYVELAELLQVSESSIARKMKDLQASGEIRRVGADKNGHWEVCK